MSNASFEQRLRPHFDRLYRLAWRLTGAQADAEDLFQDLLIKAFEQQDRLVDIEEPGAWLSRVMYNLFIDNKRRYRRERLTTVNEAQLPGDGFEDIASDLDPQADTARIERMGRLHNAMKKLSEEHRIVVLLHDTEGYKINEISGLTGLAEGTIKSRLHRARGRLKELLIEDGTFSR